MITRKQYLENSAELHQVYWEQFVTDDTCSAIQRQIGPLLARPGALVPQSQHYIKLAVWDRLRFPMRNLFSELGESNTLSARVCIAKAAARLLQKEAV